MGPPKLVVSETSWRGIVIMVQSNFGIFDICSFVLNLVKLSRIIILYFQMGFQSSIKSFFDANLRSFFLKELTFIQFDEKFLREQSFNPQIYTQLQIKLEFQMSFYFVVNHFS